MERLQEQDSEKRNAQSAIRCDRAPASTILGASTVRQLIGGGDCDPLQDSVKKDEEGGVYKQIAQALVTYRYTGKNAADPKKLVMLDGQINESKLIAEYNQIVSNGPASIRWAKANGKLNFADGNRAEIEPATCSRSGRRLKRAFPGCSHPMGPHLRALLTSRVRSLHGQLTRACSKR